MLNDLGSEKKVPDRSPITLPKLTLTDIDIETEAREAAQRVREHRIVRIGLDCWRAIGKVETFQNWVCIAGALRIGRDFARKSTGKKAGREYWNAFSTWLNAHHFDGIDKQQRCAILQMIEHLPEIEQWRSTVSDERRRTLTNPVSNLRAWRHETGKVKSKCAGNALTKAEAALHHFIKCVEGLPPDKAAPFWQTAHHQAVTHLT